VAEKMKIQVRREQLELTYIEIYFRTGLNQRTVKRYEDRTSEPTLRSLVLLAYAPRVRITRRARGGRVARVPPQGWRHLPATGRRSAATQALLNRATLFAYG